MLIRIADEHDLDAIAVHDRHISKEALRRSIAAGQVLIAHAENKLAGWLRWSLFWDEIPFMNLLFLLEDYRGHGAGRALVATWEARMQEAGHKRVMTSTQANECAQHFYRHLGYEDVGAFALPGKTLELMLSKDLDEL